MKENKNVRIEIRLTPKEKEYFKQYAESRNITISELVRQALIYITTKEDKNND